MFKHHAAAWTLLFHIKSYRDVRVAEVIERNADGQPCRRVLDVRDIEERTQDPKEVILVDPETEREILMALRSYRNTLRFVAVMVAVAVLIGVLQLIF